MFNFFLTYVTEIETLLKDIHKQTNIFIWTTDYKIIHLLYKVFDAANTLNTKKNFISKSKTPPFTSTFKETLYV